jgi:CdiI immunity protein
MTSLQDDLPALWLFAGAYLHQDWLEDYDSTDAAFQDFLRSEPRHAPAAASELRTVLASDLDDSAVDELLHEAGSFYSPDADGLTAREWLTRLLELCP